MSIFQHNKAFVTLVLALFLLPAKVEAMSLAARFFHNFKQSIDARLKELGFEANTFLPPPVSSSISVQVSAGSDDAEQNLSTNSVVTNSNDLEFTYDGAPNQAVGMRFNNITIPKNATITNAYVEFINKNGLSGAVTYTISGQAIDNAPTFTTAANNITSRTKTAALVSWSAANWPTVSAAYQTSNISTIIQELVNRPGWASGNSMVIMVNGTSTTVRRAYSFEAGASLAPRLVVNYTYCDNVTTAGTIAGDQSVTGTSYDPTTISSSVAASGGSGTLEYQWESSTDNITFSNIAGATSETYDPPSITQTTYYRRKARRSDCTPYLTSNTITKTLIILVENCTNGIDDDADGLVDCHDPDCSNITNGEFDSGTTGWQLFVQSGNTATLTQDATSQLSGVNSARVNITTALGTDWHVQLAQPNKALVSGKTYSISFRARASSNRNITTVFQQSVSPFTNYWSQATALTTSGQTFTYQFTPNASNAAANLLFNVGIATGTVWIDNVVFKEVCLIEHCSNGLDDDADGLVDCEDPNCQTTQTPIVNLSAAALANGNLSSWTNSGSLGGNFGNGGTTPLVETVAGRKAVTFDGTDVMTSSFTAPAGITGNSNFTVMVWAYNPVVNDEEALLSWSYRGGGDGTNAHINYGSNPDFGAISHWGAPDMAYATIPTAGTWNHFAITYSGGTGGVERVYVNGVLNNEETKTLGIHASQPLHLGAARSSSAGGSTLHFSGSISSVKVYDQDLTAANIASIYAQESSNDCYELTNLSCSTTCQTGNVVLNGDFSSNTTNWTAPSGGLTIDAGGPNGNFLILNISDVASDFTVYQDIACTANQEYIFTAGAGRHGTSTNAKFYLEFYNGSTLLSKTPDVFVNLLYNGAFGYIYPVKGFTPANTTKIRVVGFANGTALKMDNISLKLCQNCVEICNNGLDDEGDGLIDCNDPDCNKITLGVPAVGACINHPLQDVATVSLNVAWTAPPANDSIVVSIYGKKVYIPTGSSAGNQTVSFNVPADGSTNNTITAYWINSPSLCNKTTSFNAPAACSNDQINCNILYLCGQDKPYDGDAWDHGFITYLNQINGANIVTPILTKPDASGYGTYDPMNPSNFVNINFNNYQLIVISATTENYLASGLVNYLKNSPAAILNGNYTIINDLGMASAEGSYQFQSNAYINNTTAKQIYDYHTISPYYGKVLTKANVITGGTGYLWANANNQTTNTHSIYFVYDNTDVLPGVNAGHGVRVHLGYHMNGLWAGGETGYVLPAPVESYLNPAKHFTLDGKYYLDQAILAAGTGCFLPENCNNGIDDDGDGLVDCNDPDCNLITNGEFNSSTTGWQFYVQPGNTATLSVANTSQLSGVNSALVDLTSVAGTDWHVQLAQTGRSITAGQAYTVSFQAKAATNRTATVMLQRTGPPFPNYWYQTFNLTTTAQTYSFDFISDSTNIGQVGLLFNLGANNSDVWIDKVAMTKACFTPEVCANGLDDDGDGATDANDPECFACSSGLLSNPGFSGNLAGWTNWGNTNIVPEANGNKYARTAGGYGGLGTDYPATPGTTYSLSFQARASAGEDSRGGFSFWDASYNKLGEDFAFQITNTAFKRFQVAAVAPPNTAFIRVYGWKNEGSGTADFDGFCLRLSTENCSNAADDDGDGLVDCNDPDCPCAIALAVGNVVYIDADNDKVFDAGEGVNGVAMRLFRAGDNPNSAIPVATTTTAAGGKYLFDNLLPGNYFVFIPKTEFASGKPLFGKISIDGHDGDYRIDDQLSENGVDNPNPILNGIRSSNFALFYNSEPITSGTELGFDKTSDDTNDPSDDDNTDLTIDFGFGNPDNCLLTISQAKATPCYKNASGNWVTDIEVTVYWAGFIDGDTILVSMNGKTDYFAPYQENNGVWPKGVQHFFLKEVPSNGGTGTVNAQFVVRQGCATSKSVSLPDCECPAGAVSGMAWQDFNNNGFQDSHETVGVAGIGVMAYDCGGNLVGTTSTNANGAFSFIGLANGGKYRIEFYNVPAPYFPSAMGASNWSNVQFVTAPTCHADFGVNNPDLYCEENPMIGIPCYVNGSASAPGVANHEAFVFFPYEATATYNTNTNLIERSVYPTLGALVGQTGATWGVAYQRNTKTVFTSAVIKRHVGLGPLGTGGIYKINVSNPSAPVATSWIDVKTLGIDTGTDPRDGSPGNTLPTSTGDPSYDLNAYDAVGKKAIGDIDFDEPRNTLWFVNLYERTLVGIRNVNPNASPTAADVLEYPIAIPAGYSCGPTHEFRPWGLKVHEGKIYIGIICTNISDTWWNYAGLKAFIVSFDPNAPASGFSYVTEIDMTYDKYQYGVLKYNNWVRSYNDLSYGYGYTSPIISDIEFDTDGAMILGIADRLGLQMGYFNYAPDKNMTDQTLYTMAQSGDILRLCKVGNNYVSPGSDPSCPLLGVVHGDGINGGEHYWGDWGPKVNELMSMDNGFNETAMGGIAMRRGSGEVVTTQTDAVIFRSGAVATYNSVTGGVTNTYTLYEGVGNGAQGKATGLGDIEVLCNSQPIEIGNYVWLDEDDDGVQDACEPPLDSVVVSLYKANGTLIGTTTTDAFGNYVFNENNVDTSGNLADNIWTGLSANANYIVVTGKVNYNGVVFANGKLRVNGIDAVLTFPNIGQGANADLNDSDGTILNGMFAAINGFPGVVITTPLRGSSHNADFGFRPLCEGFSVFAGTDISICTGTNADLTATGSGGLQPYSFAWSNGLGSGASKAVAPTSTTTYTVTLTDADGCIDIDQVTVTVTNCSEACGDGIDNDADGLIDCDDPDCAQVGQPILANDEYETCPGQLFVEQPIFNDLNIQHPVYSIFTQATKGTVSINYQGVFVYTPSSSICGIDSFRYQVCNSWTGCCDQATVTLHLGDNDPPQLQNLPADLTINCDEAIPSAPVVFGLDDCPGIYVTFSEVSNEVNAGACSDYTIVRTWSATDVCGNSATANQTITVKDDDSPEIFRVYTLANGKKLMGGVVQKGGTNWQQVRFPTSFNVTPLVFAQVVSENGAEAISPRIRNINDESFELKIQEQENGDGVHANEKIAWFAIEPGVLNDTTKLQAGNISNVTSNYKLLNYAVPFSAIPVTIASVQSNVEFDPISIRFTNATVTGIQLKLEEETSLDAETLHGNESVGFLAAKPGNIHDINGDFIAFAGKVNLTDAWKQISFPRKFTKPAVVFGGLPIGTDAATVRVRNVTSTGFEARIDEWDYLNGLASANNISYVVVEGSIPAFVENPCELNPSVLIPGLNLFSVDNCDNQVSMDYTESSQLTPNGLIYTKIWISTDDCGNAATIIRSDTCNLAAVRVKVLLGGSMIGLATNEALMRDNLRQGYFLPNTSPYVIPSSLNPGSAGQGSNASILPSLLEATGHNAIVDWMFLEIRNATDPKTIHASFPCLLQRDGDVVMANNGSDILSVSGLQEDFYFVRIAHRNHIGVMTAEPIYLKVGDVPLVDFTDPNTEVYGGSGGLKTEGGKKRLWPGDLNSDKRVIYQGPFNDVFKLFSDVLTHPMNASNLANFIRIGYENSDLNMDGNTIYQGPNNDRSLLLLQTILAHPSNTILLANFMAIELLP